MGSNWVASRAVASYYVWRQSPCKNLGVLKEKSIITTILKGKTHNVLTGHTLPSLTKHWLWAFDFFHPGTTRNIIKSRLNTSFHCVIFYVVQWTIFNCKWDSFNGDISPTFPTLSTVAVQLIFKKFLLLATMSCLPRPESAGESARTWGWPPGSRWPRASPASGSGSSGHSAAASHETLRNNLKYFWYRVWNVKGMII